jgi:hypothetical protein
VAAVILGKAGVKVGAPAGALEVVSIGGGFSCATIDALGCAEGGAADVSPDVSVVPTFTGSGALAKNVARKQLEPASQVTSEVRLSAV